MGKNNTARLIRKFPAALPKQLFETAKKFLIRTLVGRQYRFSEAVIAPQLQIQLITAHLKL